MDAGRWLRLSGVQLGEALGVDEAVNLKVRVREASCELLRSPAMPLLAVAVAVLAVDVACSARLPVRQLCRRFHCHLLRLLWSLSASNGGRSVVAPSADAPADAEVFA